MSRDVNGQYTLPAGNPVQPNSTITSNWANLTLENIADALTDSLSRSGNGGMSVPLQFSSGSESAPGITFDASNTTGFFFSGSPTISMEATVDGNSVMRWIRDSSGDNNVQIYKSNAWIDVLTGLPEDLTGDRLNVGITVNAQAYYQPTGAIYHYDDGRQVYDTNLGLGDINPSMIFSSNLDANSAEILTTKISRIGLVTTEIAGTFAENLTAGELVITSDIVSVFSGTFLASAKAIEVGGNQRVSINVFNKMGSEAVTTRTNNAQLMVMGPEQDVNIVPNTVYTIVVTDSVNETGGSLPGGGGGIGFSSGANSSGRTTPSAFACIRGSIRDGRDFTEGNLDFYSRSDRTTNKMTLVARVSSAFEIIEPLIIWETFDLVDPSNNTRGIVSDSVGGFNYDALTAKFNGSFATFGFTKQGASYFLHVNGATGVQISTGSDYRIKNEIGLLENGLDTIKLMRPIEYTEKEGINSDVIRQGFIAHEMQAIMPSIVNGNKDDVDEDGEINPQSIYYAGLTPILIKAVQELTARIEALEAL